MLVTLLEAIAGYPPVLPWSGPLVLIFMAAVVGAMAYTTWRRVQVHKKGMEPERGIRYLALGKASALGGVAVAAGYLALVVLSLENVSAAGPQQRVIRGSVAVVGGLLLAAAGLWLERACRIPHPPEDGDEPAAES
jgi:hypothetical protein